MSTRLPPAPAGAGPAGRPDAPGRPPRGVRVDIQGLRAIAVSLVLVYHLRPDALSGGFTGVDVFFVISGFLITTHLVQSPPTDGRGLLRFWSRRIRRLLPASLLVLVVTLVASRLVAPETQWDGTARQARAAALYVVNWLLAADSVDYLAAAEAPSPVQHFWSLSVEEQFYAGWPVLVLVLALLARRTGARLTSVVGLGMAAVVAASFAWSVHQTAVSPASAYFVTPTRIWELGAGGLLAVWVLSRSSGRRRPAPATTRVVLAWLGIAAMAWTAWTYTSATPFPGWQAAVPVLGAVLVLAADAPLVGASPVRLLAWRPVQWLGDVSYSVYLWHWPLVVLVPYATGRDLTLLDAAFVLVLTLLLAAVTKPWVEDRFRTPRPHRSLAAPYAWAAIGMAVVVAAATLQTAEVDRREDASATELRAALSGDDPCFGAAALARGASECPPSEAPLVPSPVRAAADKSQAYDDVPGGRDCFAYLPRFRSVGCEFGAADADVRVALVGNSHAGQWLPTVQRIADGRGWRTSTFLASRCALADVDQALDTARDTRSCRDWVRRTTEQVADGGFDLVLLTNRISSPAVGETFATTGPAYEQGYRRVLERLAAGGSRVVALHDTPFPGSTLDGTVPDCLALHEQDRGRCGGARETWLQPDPVLDAAEDLDDPRVAAADLSDLVCGPERCEGAVGGTPVYFDNSHLTATYARSLAPYLDPVLERALSGGS